MPLRCVDVGIKGDMMVFKIEGPPGFNFDITRRITKFKIRTTFESKELALYSKRGNVIIMFLKFRNDTSSCTMYHFVPNGFNYLTSRAIWDKVVALLS